MFMLILWIPWSDRNRHHIRLKALEALQNFKNFKKHQEKRKDIPPGTRLHLVQSAADTKLTLPRRHVR